MQPRRSLSNVCYGERRRSSITDTIEKFKSKRADQEYINDMLRQKRDSVVNLFDPSNAHDYTGRGHGSQTRLNQYEDTSHPVYKPVAPTSSQLPPGRTILDEMRIALEVAEHGYDDDIICGRRRWHDNAARDYIYDIGRAGYERVKDNRNIIRDLRRPTRQPSYQNKAPVHRNINRPQIILLDEESSVVQLNFRRKNPTYIKDQQYPLSPVPENRSRVPVAERKKSSERKRKDSVLKIETTNVETVSSTSMEGKEKQKQLTEPSSDLNKSGNSRSRFLKSEQQLQDSTKPTMPLKQKTYAGSPSPIGIFRERALTSADLSRRRKREHVTHNTESDQSCGNPQPDHEQTCPNSRDQPQDETKGSGEINESDIDKSKTTREFEEELGDSFSTDSETDQEDTDKSNSEYIWNDVRRCRYLRGYDPPEMLLPRGEINLFVFGRDENDILEFKRTNERKIHAELEDPETSHDEDQ